MVVLTVPIGLVVAMAAMLAVAGVPAAGCWPRSSLSWSLWRAPVVYPGSRPRLPPEAGYYVVGSRQSSPG